MNKKLFDRIDSYVDDLIKRHPKEVRDLIDLVGRYQRGEVSPEENAAARKAALKRAAQRR